MKALARFKDIHKGETCVIVGNGPSLRLDDLGRLSAKYPTFGSNQIYRLPFTPTYYCIVDEVMMADCLPLPKTFQPKEMFLRAEAGVGNPIYPIVAAGFGLDLTNFVVMGGTVSYVMLQIAIYMGFTTNLLTGMDHHYPKTGRFDKPTIFTANGDDPDHFQPADGQPYFKQGQRYNAPELAGTTQSYTWARELFDKSGREAVNISRQTKLDVFRRDTIENWI